MQLLTIDKAATCAPLCAYSSSVGTGKRTKTHQYSVTEYDTVVHKGQMQMPSVLFIYDLSPISVTITEARKSFAHLLVRVCAVVGGVFAVTGAPLCWPTLAQSSCCI